MRKDGQIRDAFARSVDQNIHELINLILNLQDMIEPAIQGYAPLQKEFDQEFQTIISLIQTIHSQIQKGQPYESLENGHRDQKTSK